MKFFKNISLCDAKNNFQLYHADIILLEEKALIQRSKDVCPVPTHADPHILFSDFVELSEHAQLFKARKRSQSAKPTSK